MKRNTILFIALITANILALPAASQAEEGMEILRKNARIWAFDATKKTMTLGRENFSAEIRQKHKNFLSERGCNSLRNVLENYGITEILNGRYSSMVAEFWDRQKRVEPLDQIKLKEEAYNAKTELYSWRVEVPLTLHFKGRNTRLEYNFRALIDLEQTLDKTKPFIIDRWWESQTTKSTNELIQRSTRNQQDEWKVCTL